MFCTNCGKQIKEGASICPHCGKSVSQMVRAVAPDDSTDSEQISPSKVIKQTLSFYAKLLALVVGAALTICFVIGVIVWFVEYKDRTKPYNGAKVKTQTIWEESGLSVKATKLTNDRVLRDALIFKVKNNSGRNLTIQCISFAVNGISVPANLDDTIANGEKKDIRLEMDLGSSYMKKLGVETPGVFTIELSALEASSGEEVFRSGFLTVNTTKASLEQHPSLNGYYDRHYGLYDQNGVRVQSFGYLLDPIGPGFGIENSFERSVKVTIRIKTISGQEMREDDHYYIGSSVIQPGTIGALYTPAYFEELQRMDVETPIFPVTKFSGLCTVTDAHDGSVIWEEPFTYTEAK